MLRTGSLGFRGLGFRVKEKGWRFFLLQVQPLWPCMSLHGCFPTLGIPLRVPVLLFGGQNWAPPHVQTTI